MLLGCMRFLEYCTIAVFLLKYGFTIVQVYNILHRYMIACYLFSMCNITVCIGFQILYVMYTYTSDSIESECMVSQLLAIA